VGTGSAPIGVQKGPTTMTETAGAPAGLSEALSRARKRTETLTPEPVRFECLEFKL